MLNFKYTAVVMLLGVRLDPKTTTSPHCTGASRFLQYAPVIAELILMALRLSSGMCEK